MTHPRPSGIDLLPADVWLKIFHDIEEDLPRATLINVSSACQAFRSFTLPLLCRRFTFYPYINGADVLTGWKRSQWLPLPPDQFDYEVQSLQFYSFTPIATYVRYIHLLPYPRETSAKPITVSGGLDVLLREFYEAIPRFTNTREFRCIDCDIDNFAFEQISRLPNLRSLHLTSCNLLSTVSTFQLQVVKFDFWHSGKDDQLERLNVERWLPMLDPSCLKEVQICPALASSFFFQDLRSVGPFNMLSTLIIPILPTKMLSQMSLLLSKMPALRHFNLSATVGEELKIIAEGLKSPPTSPTPYLEDYSGPYELLRLILGQFPESNPYGDCTFTVSITAENR